MKFSQRESSSTSRKLARYCGKAFDILGIAENSELEDKTSRPNRLWRTEIIYLKVIGWGAAMVQMCV